MKYITAAILVALLGGCGVLGKSVFKGKDQTLTLKKIDNQDITIVYRGGIPVSVCYEPDNRTRKDTDRKCSELAR